MLTRILGFAVLAVFLSVITAYTILQIVWPPEHDSMHWEMKAEALTAREDPAAAALDGKLYLLGGIEEGGLDSNAVERYDPVSDTWEKIAPMPEPRNHLMAVGYGHKLYVFGGQTHVTEGGPTSFNNTWIYDPATNSWSSGADMPIARNAADAAVLGDRIYVVGGRQGAFILQGNAKPSLSVVEAYDPATNTWETRAPLNVPRDHVGVEVLGGKLYAINGEDFTILNPKWVAEEYDPELDVWRIIERPPLPFAGDPLALDGKLIMPGGNLGPLFLGDVLAYEPGKGWSHLGLMPEAGFAYAAVTLDGVGYVVGGGPSRNYQYSNTTRTLRLVN